jgi:hypothetical protein
MDLPLPIGKNDVRLNLPRPEYWPTIYQTWDHPKKNGPGNIYYFIQDTSRKGMEAAEELERSLKVPRGPERLAIEQGNIFLSYLFYFISFISTFRFFKASRG